MEKKNEEKVKWWKKFTALQLAMFVLTALLVIASIVTMGVIIDLKNKKDAAKERNEQLESQLPNTDDPTEESWQKEVGLFIENQNNQ